jgi:hypothetical protein
VRKVVLFLCLLACVGVTVWAQEGHPLTGSWHGEWHNAAGKRTPVLVYMKWNSKEIEGMINPGPNGVAIKTTTLDPNNWTVRIEADAKDGSHITIDGKLDNIGSYNRTLTGTWSQGSDKGDCKLTRD